MKGTNRHASPIRAATGAAWGQERRLEFIEFRLLWEGRIKRAELVAFFRTSIQQASLDLARYMELAPGNLEYDKSDKLYRASSKLTLAFTPPDSQAYLNQLSGLGTGLLPPPLSYVGWRPPYDIVGYPTRSIRPDVLMRVIWAIRDAEDLKLSYQSMRRPVATRRWISPHAIAWDGTRWHVRAWCHANQYFKDFVLARVQRIYRARYSSIDPSGDQRWHSFATVILRARRSLTPSQRSAVEAEFGMRHGLLELSMREALVPYFLRQLRLDLDAPTVVSTNLIELVNQHELTPLLVEAVEQSPMRESTTHRSATLLKQGQSDG